jgi:hypothetical protein
MIKFVFGPSENVNFIVCHNVLSIRVSLQMARELVT